MNADFPIIGIDATESREDDGTGSEDGEKRLHFFFLGNRLSNRSDNVKATVVMGVNDPTPAVSSNGAAITPCPARGGELVSDDLPVFHALNIQGFARSNCRLSLTIANKPSVRNRNVEP